MSTPKLGLVVSTHGAVPFVHLHLETRKRLYPDVPMLVHDDHSEEVLEVCRLCDRYGVTFYSTPGPLGHSQGDMQAFASGLRWAYGNDIDLLVKMSRRFVPLEDWTKSLMQLNCGGGVALWGGDCWMGNLGKTIRTNCVALLVERWALLVPAMQAWANNHKQGMADTVEDFIWQAHRLIAPDMVAYGQWGWLGAGQNTRASNHLWHHWATPAEYAAYARSLGLSYSEGDFVVDDYPQPVIDGE